MTAGNHLQMCSRFSLTQRKPGIPTSTIYVILTVGDSERPVGFNSAICIAPERRALAAAELRGGLIHV
jgi:hypothetical protein